jgi:epoxyqueuosine reductase
VHLGQDRLAELALAAGFELAGVAPALPVPDTSRYRAWVDAGMAGEMGYMRDERRLAAGADWARSVICVGKLYNVPQPYSTQFEGADLGWIARYAWGRDYHKSIRSGLHRLAHAIHAEVGYQFQWRACVDTSAVLERSYARAAGLGWIGRNTCLIHEGKGSWYFLGELFVSLDLEPGNGPAPDRCGTCTRCLDVCPTEAFISDGDGGYRLDARLCISYLTIELRDSIPVELRRGVGRHVFGCDLCQDVCPWNRKAPVTTDPSFQAEHFAPPLEKLAALSEQEFRKIFRGTPVTRARYSGFLRNVAVAMGNAKLDKFREPLERLAAHENGMVAEHARWALQRLEE